MSALTRKVILTPLSALDFAGAIQGKFAGAGFEPGQIEAAVEFLVSSGYQKMADDLPVAAKAADQSAKSKRTAQRQRMENKKDLGRNLEM